MFVSGSTWPSTLKPCSRVMLGASGVSATEHQLEIVPCLETPGYAKLIGGAGNRGSTLVPIEEAELLKINHERSIHMLEGIYDMPLTRNLDQKLCRCCSNVTTHRCSACWSWYCSKACQRRNWPHHVFVCGARARPNDVDFFRLTVMRVARDISSAEEEGLQNAIRYVLADDHVCSTFGFKDCRNALEVIGLVCIYNTILSRVQYPIQVLQDHVQTGNLGNFLTEFCERERQNARISKEDEFVTWFLEHRTRDLVVIPNIHKVTYGIWDVALASAVDSLGLEDRFDKGEKLGTSQADVFGLYLEIQPSTWLLPDIHSSSWVKFGFCYCKSFSQRRELAQKYLALALSRATFDDIVSAYETSSLAGLMCAHGINISELENQGIQLRRPPPCEYSIYRLMIGVEHALSGRFCSCFSVRGNRDCHTYYETHIDRESDANFGFRLTNSWERWQLLNFYQHLFRLPSFDLHLMAQATKIPILEAWKTISTALFLI
jgi:hypothetical protein